MLRISLQTLKDRRGSLVGAFAAILLAVTFAYSAGLLMTGALSAPGAGRFAAADAVVRANPSVTTGRGEDRERVNAIPGPRLSTAAVARAGSTPGAARAVGDVAFPVAVAGLRHGRTFAHGWPSAALTRYRLSSGRAPRSGRELVADSRLGLRVGRRLDLSGPGGHATFEVTGIARGRGAPGQSALFLSADAASRLSGSPGSVNAIGVVAAPGTSAAELRARLRHRLGRAVEVLGPHDSADADAGDPRAASRASQVAIFGTMGGIAGAVALFVVAGAFGLATAQRRREIAVLRALGASSPQVRRLLSLEALLVALVAGLLGLVAGGPLATAIARAVTAHGGAPEGFSPGHSTIALAAALGMGVVIAQLAVVAAARRASRIPASAALREVAVEHSRPGVARMLAGALCLAGGAVIAIAFSGLATVSFAILASLLMAMGVGLLGPWLLALPAVLLSLPLRALRAPGMLASASVGANRWRTAALASPIVLITVLVATQGFLQASDRDNSRGVAAGRVAAGHVLVGRHGAALPGGTAARVARLPGVTGTAATLPTEVFLLDSSLDGGDASRAVGLRTSGTRAVLDLRVRDGRLGDVRGRSVAISHALASEDGLHVGDSLRARLADTTPATLHVAAVYGRAAGLGDVVLDPDLARAHAAVPADDAVFVGGGVVPATLAGSAHVRVLTRAEYLDGVDAANGDDTWAIWLIVALAAVFASLGLVNSSAMATTERGGEVATIRLLGGSSAQITWMIALEMLPAVLTALVAGLGIAALSVIGLPHGATGMPLVTPASLVAGVAAGALALGLLAALVAVRLTRRVSPAAAMRAT